MLNNLPDFINKEICISVLIVISAIIIYFILKKFIKKVIEKQEKNLKRLVLFVCFY